MPFTSDKLAVKEFWNSQSCGEVYTRGDTPQAALERQAAERYRLEPNIPVFAGFDDAPGRDVLEIGVGMGADHLEWAKRGPRSLTGIDLTERAVAFTKARLEYYGLQSDVRAGDAENLPFADNSFDIVYSYGVLHHSPDTAQCLREVRRVLRPGGSARIMIYHRRSMVGYMLWARYALAAGRPWLSLTEIYAQHLESPGTKAFSVAEARAMLAGFSSLEIETPVGFGDLLMGEVGQRHRGALLSAAKRLYPRWLVRMALPNHGLGMLIRARKDAGK